MRGALLVLTCLTAAAASAQSPDLSARRLLLPDGPLRGGPRVMALGGAVTGIAEGPESALRNPAAVANPDPRSGHAAFPDLGFALHFLPPWGVYSQDWDNDGRRDGQVGPLTSRGSVHSYGLVSGQYRHLGLAVGYDLQSTAAETATRGYDVALFHLYGVVGVSLFDDALQVGGGVESTHGLITLLENRAVTDTVTFGGLGAAVGALYRPAFQDFRLGASFHSGAVAPRVGTRPEIGGLSLPAAVVAQPRLSLGASWAVGAQGRPYNIPLEGWDAAPAFRPRERIDKVLLSAQLDVTFPVADAVSTYGFLEQGERPPDAAGDQLRYTPRLGVEKEFLEGQVRVRAGGYLEPPLVSAATYRPHVTFGVESFLIRLPIVNQVGVGVALDFARAYSNLSAAALVWWR